MTRKLKALGVALVAVLALAAVMASAAAAASYTASSYPTTGTATSAVGNDRLTTEGGAIECASHYAATLNAASTTLTVTPTYTSCKSFGFLSATVNMNGCDYLYTEPTGSGPSYSAKVDVVCPAGKVIEFTSGTCKLTFASQGPLSSLTVTNAAGGDVLTKASLSGISYSVVQDGFGCAFNGTGAKTGATFTQASSITFDSTNGATVDVG